MFNRGFREMMADGKKRKKQNSVPDLAADRTKEKEITGEESRMKTDRELRAERRESEKRARKYMQAGGKSIKRRMVGVGIENEKIDLPADGGKKRKNQNSVEEKTDRELRAERRDRERRERIYDEEHQRLVKRFVRGFPVWRLDISKIDLPEVSHPDLVEEEKSIRVDDAPVYAGEELDEIKANWAKFDDVLRPWETKYGAGMDDKKQWPPIWKQKFEESPEYGAFEEFLREGRRDDLYKEICQEIRNSRGYDISYGELEYIPYQFHEMPRIERCMAVGACKHVTDQINERAEDHGESYLFDEVKKVVRWRFPFLHYWYTFTVKQQRPTCGNIKTVQAFAYCRSRDKVLVFLKEWRFKP